MTRNKKDKKNTPSKGKPIIDIKLDENPIYNPIITLPNQETNNKKLIFSFELVDRFHPYFNMGTEKSDGTPQPNQWFLDVIDCFKEIAKIPISNLPGSKFDLHAVQWDTANFTKPKIENLGDDVEFYQFRINKSTGRIIGVKIDNIFYIVWFDSNHNLTNSSGYRNMYKTYIPKSSYDVLNDKYNDAKNNADSLSKKLTEYCELIISEKCEICDNNVSCNKYNKLKSIKDQDK